MGPLPVNEGPAAGQTILYFQAPWGLQLEAISYPNGMAYEKDAETVLWSPKDPREVASRGNRAADSRSGRASERSRRRGATVHRAISEAAMQTISILKF